MRLRCRMTEIPQSRKFEDLNPSEKVASILSVTREPVSRGMAIVLAGISYDKLTSDQKEELDILFGTEKLTKTKDLGREVFIASDDFKIELSKTIDLMDVKFKLLGKRLAIYNSIKNKS